ncbi:MAG: ABC transporter ATP-binding protein [Bacillota bacterium]|jgi:peptide/nickel transport system ATP-binding protein|nr:ABC transporter ATP-binding protein [Bacillota bacterium]HPZ53988.1 ABC transporter ATP-binding protein [Bacillota bacterium]HQD17458.1 ABC transporter ATP-binding protein [Bacillota bacterium]
MRKTSSDSALLRIEGLRLHFKTMRGTVQAVDDVTFSLNRGRTLVVVGESGCGKSSLARGILRLLPRNVETYSGKIYLNGDELMCLTDERFRREVRWVRMSMVPQAAMNSLNPVVRVEDQVAEPLLVHKCVTTREEAYERAREAFRMVGVPLDFMTRYPFELSGGMRQRVALAMALVTDPELVVLDEPTSALDLLTQANIMNVLKQIKKDIGVTFILITHDIATSSELADDAAVMYAGQLVEFCDAGRFYLDPLHPYSRGLMGSVPTLWERKDLMFIPGQPPSLLDPPKGCRFAERCPDRFDKCEEEPPLTEVDVGHWVKCWLHR